MSHSCPECGCDCETMRIVWAMEAEGAGARAATREAEIADLKHDLLWAMWAFMRLGYPGSIADLFEYHHQPGLKAEYEAVAHRWWPAGTALAETPHAEPVSAEE
jgi:hypothetical protein